MQSRFNEVNNLRNSLFHFTPLNIYLVYGKKIRNQLNNEEKINVVKCIYRLSGNQSKISELHQICNYSQKFIEIKKGQRLTLAEKNRHEAEFFSPDARTFDV